MGPSRTESVTCRHFGQVHTGRGRWGTESQGHSEYCGSAPCGVWGRTQHQGGKGPTERGICPHIGPAWLLLALTASRSGAAQTQGQELILPRERHQAGLFLVGLQDSGLWDPSGYSCVPVAQQGPRQLGQGQAWTRRAMAGPQHLCPPHRGRAQFHPNLQSPAAHMAVPRGFPPCEGLPPLWVVFTRPGAAPSPATHHFSVSGGLGLPPLPECHRLGARDVTA